MIHIAFYMDETSTVLSGKNYHTSDVLEAIQSYKKDFPNSIFIYAQNKTN